MKLTNEDVNEALSLAARLEGAYRRGLIDPAADADNIKLLWVLQNLGYLFEWEDWEKFEEAAMQQEAEAND